MRCAYRAIAVLLCAPALLSAQDVDNRSSPAFLERSYIFHRFPPHKLLFEGHIAPHLFFHQGFYQATGGIYQGPDWASRSWSLSMTPMIRLRMFGTRSKPVRTPSFMPKFNLQFFWASLTDPSQGVRSPVRVVALNAIPWGHHSNGQEGCLYADQTMVDTLCVDGPLPPGTRRTTNKENGSFSTNYFRVWGAYRYMRLDRRLRANRTCTLTLGFEGNPKGFGPGAISDEQKALYPTTRIISSVELSRKLSHPSWLVGRVSGSVQGEYLRRTAPHIRPWTFTGEVSHASERLGGWGLFLRYYWGMDYYNLGFLDHSRYLHVGLVFDATRADEFALPPNSMPQPGPKGDGNFLDGLCELMV